MLGDDITEQYIEFEDGSYIHLKITPIESDNRITQTHRIGGSVYHPFETGLYPITNSAISYDMSYYIDSEVYPWGTRVIRSAYGLSVTNLSVDNAYELGMHHGVVEVRGHSLAEGRISPNFAFREYSDFHDEWGIIHFIYTGGIRTQVINNSLQGHYFHNIHR